MGAVCGCKREIDDLQETNLVRKKTEINNNVYLSNNSFEKKFNDQLESIGEIFPKPIEEIIPENITKIRASDPFIASNKDKYDNTNQSHIYHKDQIKLKNGVIYSGGWSNSFQMEGKGLMYIIEDQILLEGYWKNNIFTYGRIYFKDGSYYEGEVLGTVLNGQGKYISNTKEKYEGSFHNGYRDGQGSYHYSDGAVYVGQFKQDTISGNGIMKWADGSIFKGDFSNNCLHGRGELTSAFSNNKYDGNFKCNWLDGQGVYIWSNGHQYVGMYERGKKEGKGKYKLNGIEINGSWSNGSIQGKSIISYNGRSYTTLWRNGRLFEIKEQLDGNEMEIFNNIPIQKENYDPELYPHLAILDESKIHFYKPLQPVAIGLKSFESYFSSSRSNQSNN